MKKRFVLSALAIANLMSVSAVAEANAETTKDAEMFDMKAVSCRELMLAGTDNRGLMMSLFHGFISGQKNETTFNPDTLATVTDDIQNYCIDNPNAELLDVFKKYRQ
ncbi:MAG: HdeA/HdeB family chaperone [Synechocystis sp.]